MKIWKIPRITISINDSHTHLKIKVVICCNKGKEVIRDLILPLPLVDPHAKHKPTQSMCDPSQVKPDTVDAAKT